MIRTEAKAVKAERGRGNLSEEEATAFHSPVGWGKASGRRNTEEDRGFQLG